MEQKLNYMHINPITGKWNLVNDFTSYENSSASFYELGLTNIFLQGILEIYRMDV